MRGVRKNIRSALVLVAIVGIMAWFGRYFTKAELCYVVVADPADHEQRGTCERGCEGGLVPKCIPSTLGAPHGERVGGRCQCTKPAAPCSMIVADPNDGEQRGNCALACD